jgi:hypothetical protein
MAGPIQTDEPVDRIFSRPVARLLVRILAPTPITANQVTGFAALIGLSLGAALWLQLGWLSAGLALAFLALDCADGQLSRLRGGGGYLGRAMDGFGDYITAVAMHVGLAMWIAADHGLLCGWAASATAGAAMAWASFLLDRYKRRYRGDTDDLVALREEAERTPGVKGWMISTLEPYARRLEGGVTIPDRQAYQRRLRGPMILWLLGGPTMHMAALVVCVALQRPVIYTAIAVGPMLLLTVVSLLWQQRAQAREPAVVHRARG